MTDKALRRYTRLRRVIDTCGKAENSPEEMMSDAQAAITAYLSKYRFEEMRDLITAIETLVAERDRLKECLKWAMSNIKQPTRRTNINASYYDQYFATSAALEPKPFRSVETQRNRRD